MLHLQNMALLSVQRVALQPYRKFSYPGRVYLPKSKDFNYTGQLGLCYLRNVGLDQLDTTHTCLKH